MEGLAFVAIIAAAYVVLEFSRHRAIERVAELMVEEQRLKAEKETKDEG